MAILYRECLLRNGSISPIKFGELIGLHTAFRTALSSERRAKTVIYTEGITALEYWRFLEKKFCFLLLDPANDGIRSGNNCALGKAGRYRKVHLEELRDL
jgi:hypothetical protein